MGKNTLPPAGVSNILENDSSKPRDEDKHPDGRFSGYRDIRVPGYQVKSLGIGLT